MVLDIQIVKGFIKFLNYVFSKLSFSDDGISVVSTVSSNHDHYITSLGRFQNVPIALGGAYSGGKHVESLYGGSWRNMGDFPFVESYIYYYSFVSFNSELYIFGKISIFKIFENKI